MSIKSKKIKVFFAIIKVRIGRIAPGNRYERDQKGMRQKKKPLIAAYYFPNWHVDGRNEKLHGKNWTEWRVVQYATPRFPGHEQPKVPQWGYDDEAVPADMARKIAAAADHGIDAFIFDWYYFADGSYRERCLREGFLKASNRDRLKFALMWANHDPIYAHPGSYRNPAEMLWSGSIDPATFFHCTEHVIKHYFTQPNYLRIRDGLYFSIWNWKRLTESLGGLHAVRMHINDFRIRVEKAGLGKLHLDCMAGYPDNCSELNHFIDTAGIDSVSNYTSLRGTGFPSFEFDEMTDLNNKAMFQMSRQIKTTYNPVVTTGYDNSPRTVQSDIYEDVGYPFNAVAVNNGPEHWKRALLLAKEFVESDTANCDILHLSCWNEWTEGAYLEPDRQDGYKRLEALRDVFGKEQLQ